MIYIKPNWEKSDIGFVVLEVEKHEVYNTIKLTYNDKELEYEIKNDVEYIGINDLEICRVHTIGVYYYDQVTWIHDRNIFVPCIDFSKIDTNNEDVVFDDTTYPSNITQVATRHIRNKLLRTTYEDCNVGYDFDWDFGNGINYQSFVHNQIVRYEGEYIGQAGSCVFHAIASALDAMQNAKGETTYTKLSVAWGWGGKTDSMGEEGAMYYNALDKLKIEGTPPYQLMLSSHVTSYPDNYFYYDKNGYAGARTIYNQKKSENMPYAISQRIGSWEELLCWIDGGGGQTGWDDITDSKRLQDSIMHPDKAVLMTLFIDKSFDNVGSDGVVGSLMFSSRGGHMVHVIGWKKINGKRYWIIQNSWGTSWGKSGIGYVPFNWVADGYGINSFYIIRRDLTAPPMPPLPEKINPPSIYIRWRDRFDIKTNIIAGATKYEFRGRVGTSSNYVVSDNFYINSADGHVSSRIMNLISGTTYRLSCRFYRDGVWSGWSDESMGTTNPYDVVINSAYSTTSTNLVFNVSHKDGYDGGDYSYINVEISDYSSGALITSKKFTSSPISDVFTSLITGSKCTLVVNSYLVINGVTLKNDWGDVKYGVLIGNIRPPMFLWSTPKIKGNKFSLTAKEYNDFTKYLNELAIFKNKETKVFVQAKPSNRILATTFSEATSMLYGLSMPFNPKEVKAGEPITADLLNFMVKCANEIS